MTGEIDWGKLSFTYIKTDYNVRCYYRDGKWGELEISSSESINLHMAATCLHYGQEAFEGLKAFKGKDGKVRIFRMADNAKRMQDRSEEHTSELQSRPHLVCRLLLEKKKKKKNSKH